MPSYRFIAALLFFRCLCAHAQGEACSPPDLIEQIKSYIICQASPAIDACAGLGTEIGGRMLITPASAELEAILSEPNFERKLAQTAWDNYLKAHTSELQNPDEYIKEKKAKIAELEAKIHIIERDPAATIDSQRTLEPLKQSSQYLKTVLFWMEDAKARGAKIRYIPDEGGPARAIAPIGEGAIFNWLANMPLDKAPEHIKRDIQLLVQKVKDEVRKRLLTGKAMSNESNILVSQLLDSNSGVTLSARYLRITKYIRMDPSEMNAIVRGSMLKAQTILSESIMLQNSRSALRMLGPKAPLLAGGAVGFAVLAALVAADQAFSSKATACDEIHHMWIHADKSNHCRPKYQIDANVFRFLELPESRQQEALENPQVCDFYRHLYNDYFDQPKFTSLKCTGAGFDLHTIDSAGKKLRLEGVYRNTYSKNPGGIRQVTFHGDKITPGSFSINREGNIDMNSAAQNPQVVLKSKMILMDAYDCCTTKNRADHQKCSELYNPASGGASGSYHAPNTQSQGQ